MEENIISIVGEKLCSFTPINFADHMRKIIVLFIFALGLFSHVSAVDFSDDRGVAVSVLFGISQEHRTYAHKDNHYGLVVSPSIGYRFNPTWEAGALFRYEKFGEFEKYFGVGIYGEWSFLRFASGLRLITEAHATYNFYTSDADAFYPGMPSSNKDMTEVGFTPCLAYRIGKSPVELKLRYLFVGFNHSERFYKSAVPGCLGRGDWIVDASLRRLEIGASITF